MPFTDSKTRLNCVFIFSEYKKNKKWNQEIKV